MNSPAPEQQPDLKLGLIGRNIAASKAPLLHRLCGLQFGMVVQYDRLVPQDRGQEFDEVFDDCITGGYRGINITYPFKEMAAARVTIDDPLVRAMGAVNTVIFTDQGQQGFNTDYSGFVTAYKLARGDAAPGRVCLLGSGGVGRAVAFGLLALGVSEIRLVDLVPEKAAALHDALIAAKPDLRITLCDDAATAAAGADGLVNCTPTGMVGYDGTPLPKADMAGSEWAFDAIYTPLETQFMQDAAATGLQVISGYELFFHQGVDAWHIFAGKTLDQDRLRRDLLNPPLSE